MEQCGTLSDVTAVWSVCSLGFLPPYQRSKPHTDVVMELSHPIRKIILTFSNIVTIDKNSICQLKKS